MTLRRHRLPFGPDAAAVAQGLWTRQNPGGEDGFRKAMAEADPSAAQVLEAATQIVRGAGRTEARP